MSRQRSLNIFYKNKQASLCPSFTIRNQSIFLPIFPVIFFSLYGKYQKKSIKSIHIFFL